METESPNTDIFKHFEKAIEMARLFNMMNDAEQAEPEAPPPQYNEEQARPAASVEALTDTPELRGIKAALPYLDERYQRNISIFIKLVEMQRLLEAYGRRVIDMHARQDPDWRRGMLKAIRPHMPEEKQKQIDTLLNALSMQELMWKMREDNL